MVLRYCEGCYRQFSNYSGFCQTNVVLLSRFTCDFFDAVLSPMDGSDEEEDEQSNQVLESPARGIAWIMVKADGDMDFAIR